MTRGGLAAKVQEARLWSRLMALAAIGGTAKGGVCRLALTAEDGAARVRLANWATARGFTVSEDAIGNIYVRREGTDPTLPPVMTGSHLDTQPTGGKFDGVYGVLAGFEVLEVLEDAGVQTRRAIEVVGWMNEEGARFQPGCMGSGVFAGAMPLEAMRAVADKTGATVGASIDALPTVGATRDFGFPVHAYVEAHIEQGPRLEAAGDTIGIVTGIQGARWFAVEITGSEAHAGTTPRAQRKDALMAALDGIQALRAVMTDPDDQVRFTVGRMEVGPGSPNTVPGRVFFTIDFRHPDAATVQRLGDLVAPTLRAAAGPCGIAITETFTGPPVAFDPLVIEAVTDATKALGYKHHALPSGANHDAKFLARVCPTGMIFIPCLGGVSHNEAESATPEDCAAGARVLAETLLALAQ